MSRYSFHDRKKVSNVLYSKQMQLFRTLALLAWNSDSLEYTILNQQELERCFGDNKPTMCLMHFTDNIEKGTSNLELLSFYFKGSKITYVYLFGNVKIQGIWKTYCKGAWHKWAMLDKTNKKFRKSEAKYIVKNFLPDCRKTVEKYLEGGKNK